MAFSKIILNGTTLMDVTNDTVATDNLLTGYTATGADGLPVVGSATGGNDFIVTFFWNSSLWACDKTYAEIEAAYNAGKNIVVTTNDLDAITAEGYWDDTNDYFVFVITVIDGNSIYKWSGYIDSDSIHGGWLDDASTYILPNFQTVTKTYTPTTSQQTETVTYSSSYNGLQEVDITVNAMPSGTVTAPASISGTSATVSTGTNTLTLTKSVSVTPNVTTAGYISSGTAGNASVSLTANVTTKAAATITPGTTNQTIASGTYLTGTQTIAGDADLVASNIVSGVQIFGVTGNVVLQNYYTGSSAPSSSLGNNGDLYLQNLGG